MSSIKYLLLALLVFSATSLPWKAQISLANSLQVGRDQIPQTWGCVGCTEENKPLISYMIEQKEKDVKCALSVYEQYTVLSFRYTNTIKNVGQDLLWAIQQQDQLAPQGCKVQKEMDNMWNSIRDDVLKGLDKHKHTGRLIITGISLGGALSVLSYVDIKGTGLYQNIQIITFGAPRVGNKKWAAWFDSITPSTRYFIKADPIAVLPRCLTLICNYAQTGTPIECNKNTQVCQVKNANSFKQELAPMSEYVSELTEAVMDHINDQDQLGGILDHVYGYKKIYEYSQVQ